MITFLLGFALGIIIANKTILQASFIALSIICIAIIADSIAKLKKAIMVNGTVMNATENIMDGEFPCRKVIKLQKKF